MNHDGDDGLSYDPRSWAGPPRPAISPPATPVVPAPSASPRVTPLRYRWIGPAAGIATALSGAIVAWLARPDADAPATSSPTAVADARPVERRTLTVVGGGALRANLLAIGIAPADAAAAAAAATPRLGRGNGELRLQLALAPAAAGLRLRALTATRADGAGVHLTARDDGGYAARPVTARLARRLVFVRGELDGDSFYSSAVAAGVADVLVGEFANAFRYDFDMQREVAAGDVFEAGYDQPVNADGEPVGLPTLVYAALATAAKSRALYRGGGGEWFDAAGRSSRRALMRTPVEAARISSGFGMRNHPILGFARLHRGTDFAAPTGTPVFAAGDATVTFAALKGANGNFVRLHHPNGWDTLYLHLNRIAAGLAPGQRVTQGQQIGEVGTTGRSTGPHLHYELHIGGTPVDPLSIDTASERRLSARALAAFRRVRDRIDVARAAAPR